MSQSLAGFLLLWGIPSEGGRAVLGLSLGRMAMLGILLFLGLAFLMFAVGVWRNLRWGVYLSQTWHQQLHQPEKCGVWVLGSVIGLISGSFFTLITPEITEPFAAAIFVRLRPFALLAAGLAGQTLIALPLIRFGAGWRHELRENPELSRVAFLYGLFLLLAGGVQAYVSRTGPDPVGWNTLGTPLLDTQVGCVFLVGLLLVGVSGVVEKRRQPPPGWQFDLVIGAMLWVAAAWYWHSLPMIENWYISAPRYPTFSFYPNSDGIAYDTTAQSLLSGMGYQSSRFPYPRRPLYDLFLFGLYLVKGQDFEAVVSLQTILFAIFPALVYGMVKNLHSRLAGIIAGILVLLREGTAMALTNVITVSHSKMAMSDFPTAMGVVLFAWVVFRWLKTPQRLGLILIAGGIVAAWMQIRIETGVFIPVVFGLALVHLPRLKTRYWTSLFAFVGCMVLVLAPWVYRNWKLTGLIFLETPDNRIGFLSGRLQQTADDEAPQLPPDEGGQTATPHPKKRPTPLATSLPLQSAPSGFLQTLGQHALHSLSQAILIFPDTYRIFDSTIGWLGHKNPDTFWTQCCSGKDYVKRLPYWEWGKWSGEIPPQSVIPILVNLLILAIGFRQTWKQHRWNSLLPLGLALGYYFANGLARTSGGRYILPVDWVWIGYYSVGLAYLITGIFHLFGRTPSWIWTKEPAAPPPAEIAPRSRRKTYLAICLGFFLLGVSIPAAEGAFPPRYTDETLASWLSAFVEADDGQITPHLHSFLTQGGTVLQGGGHYLRFYGPDQGEPGSLYPAVYPRPYSQLSIFLVGPTNVGVSLPLAGKPEIRAGNAADVLVFGCYTMAEKGPFLDALTMFYPSTGEIFVREPLPETFTCPLSEP